MAVLLELEEQTLLTPGTAARLQRGAGACPTLGLGEPAWRLSVSVLRMRMELCHPTALDVAWAALLHTRWSINGGPSDHYGRFWAVFTTDMSG